MSPNSEQQAPMAQRKVSTERMPSELIAALALVKRACATANRQLDLLSPELAEAIDQATQQVLAGHCDPQLHLTVWQAASGKPTHQHMNDVLAQLASENLLKNRGTDKQVQADAHVNLGQSSSDIFSTAIHVAASVGIAHNLLPALAGLRAELMTKSELSRDNANPALSQELSGHLAQLAQAHDAIKAALPLVCELAITGALTSTDDRLALAFGEHVADALAKALALPFVSTPEKFTALTSLETLVSLHGTLKSAALSLMKISSDMRSLTPSSDNPTHCDALTMVCCQVMGNDVALTVGAATGQFEGHALKPLIAHNVLQSIRLLTDATTLFTDHFARGAALNRERAPNGLASSLMLVTSRIPQMA
ncbi:MAG: class II fumarate hydratase [Rubrivivax sp.]|nr:MAG: class II fumarate hydratase [Rubrivivax sp.]